MHFQKFFAVSIVSIIVFFSVSRDILAFKFSQNYEYADVLRREAVVDSAGTLLKSNRLRETALRDFSSEYGSWEFIWDGKTLTPLIAQGEGIPILEEANSMEEVEFATMNFIGRNSALLGVTPGELVLDRKSSRRAGPMGEMWFIHFIQYYKGIPVLNTDVFFRFKFGRLFQFGSESFPEMDLNTDPVVSKKKALEIAKEAVSFSESDDHVKSSGSLFVYPQKSGGRYSFRMVYKNVIFKFSPWGEWVVYVDAHDGSVVEKFTTTYRFQGRVLGTVHPRHPSDDYLEIPFKNLGVNISGYGNVVTDSKGMFGSRISHVPAVTIGLSGPSVFARECRTLYSSTDGLSACDGTMTKVVFTPNDGWRGMDSVLFHLDDTNSSPQERDAFFFVTRAIDWARKYMGDIEWFNKPLIVNVNIEKIISESDEESKDACNAFWDGQAIFLYGEGEIPGDRGPVPCNNAANMADIVLHEWGHGLDENTGGIDDSAFSEGIADTVAFMLTKDPVISRDFYKRTNPATGGRHVREVETDKIYPQDVYSAVHETGLIISGAWWDLRKYLMEKLGDKEGMDRAAYLFLNHLFTAKKLTDSYAATLAVDDDDGNLANGTPNKDVIDQAFALHGLAIGARMGDQ